ncbi:MAG: M12 family metallopeptidase [Chitinophagaceae bacterium]|nr:M12 family metallopeptidase [Chitinophagaceae bacterium]
MADNYKTWEPGMTLLIKFMPGGSRFLRNQVIVHSREWEKFANIRFKFVPDNTPFTHIRIKLGEGLGHNSAVGTDALQKEQKDQTMNFDTLGFIDGDYYLAKIKERGIKPPFTFDHLKEELKRGPVRWQLKEIRRVVIHEFGHALGLLHEQSYPEAIKWKKTDSIYQYYMKTQGWTKQQVDFNVFEVNNIFYSNGYEYDPKSIMHYAVHPWETEDGFSVKTNYELSEGDKKIIAALYPKQPSLLSRIVPKIQVTGVGNLSVYYDTQRDGLLIVPSLAIKTNQRLGEVYFVARVANPEGFFYLTDTELFNWGGTLATYMKIPVFPNTTRIFNQNKDNPFYLFLPLYLFPQLYGKEVRITFEVFMNDVMNNHLNKLVFQSATNRLSLPARSY